MTKAAIEVSGPFSLDPQGWLGFGAVGLWVMVVSLLALRVGAWPTLLAYIGLATALAYWLIVAGFVFNQETLFTIGAALGGILLAPLWYIWAGLRLRQAGWTLNGVHRRRTIVANMFPFRKERPHEIPRLCKASYRCDLA